MEPIVGVWLTSLLGAGAFSTAGYVLGQRGVVLPFLGLPVQPKAPAPAAPERPRREHPTPTLTSLEDLDASEGTGTGATKTHASLGDLAQQELARHRASLPDSKDSKDEPGIMVASLVDEDDEDRSTAARVSERSAQTSTPVATAAEPAKQGDDTKQAELDAVKLDLRLARADLEATKAALNTSNARREEAATAIRTAETQKSDLSQQLEALRQELRREVVARAVAEQRGTELGDRLAKASEETASLRHKVATLDKQAKVLKDSAQGRMRADASSERLRKRELEEAEEMRLKLREVYDKLERSSLAPAAPQSAPEKAMIPRVDQKAATAPSMRRPDAALRDDTLVLREEIVRLTKENRALRAGALGSLPPKAPASAPPPADLDLDAYRSVIDQITGFEGVRGAVVADEVGSVLVGAGELAESLAAFGAYIRDAGARTERLLPLEGVEEVDIRDRAGMLLCTRVLATSPTALSLVILGSSSSAIRAATKLVEVSLRTR